MKSSKITAQVCLGIAIVAFIFMCLLTNRCNYTLCYDTSLAIFGSALLSSVVAHLTYKNQVRDIKIELFAELISGYRAYATFFDSFSGGIPNVDIPHSAVNESLDRFFNKYSLYSAMLGSSKGIVDQMIEATLKLNNLNSEAVLLTKLTTDDSTFWDQRKVVMNTLESLEQILVKTGKKIVAKSFGLSPTRSMDV